MKKQVFNEGTVKDAPLDDGMTFETSLESLEGIVRDLERGNLTLEDSLSQFSAATSHLRFCYSALDSAQRRIAILRDVKASGEPVLDTVDDLRQDVSLPRHRRSNPKDVS